MKQTSNWLGCRRWRRQGRRGWSGRTPAGSRVVGEGMGPGGIWGNSRRDGPRDSGQGELERLEEGGGELGAWGWTWRRGWEARRDGGCDTQGRITQGELLQRAVHGPPFPSQNSQAHPSGNRLAHSPVTTVSSVRGLRGAQPFWILTAACGVSRPPFGCWKQQRCLLEGGAGFRVGM